MDVCIHVSLLAHTSMQTTAANIKNYIKFIVNKRSCEMNMYVCKLPLAERIFPLLQSYQHKYVSFKVRASYKCTNEYRQKKERREKKVLKQIINLNYSFTSFIFMIWIMLHSPYVDDLYVSVCTHTFALMLAVAAQIHKTSSTSSSSSFIFIFHSFMKLFFLLDDIFIRCRVSVCMHIHTMRMYLDEDWKKTGFSSFPDCASFY